jgi:hypothetical protein
MEPAGVERDEFPPSEAEAGGAGRNVVAMRTPWRVGVSFVEAIPLSLMPSCVYDMQGFDATWYQTR